MGTNLRDLLAAEPRRYPGPQCQFGVFFRQLSPEHRAMWAEVLADHSVTHADLTRILPTWSKDNGYSELRISRTSMGIHRNGDCKCPR